MKWYGGGVQANLLLTDIPYDGVNQTQQGKSHANSIRVMDKGKADVKTFELLDFLELADKVVSGTFCIFCGYGQISIIAEFFREKGYTVRPLVWEKTNPSPMNGQYSYLSATELCVYAKKPKATFNAFCKSNVIRHKCGTNEIHPTMKPIGLWYELLKDLTNIGDLVLDTCMGSFTTAVACHKLQRNFIGAELDKDYFEKGYQRFYNDTAQMSIFDIIDEG